MRQEVAVEVSKLVANYRLDNCSPNQAILSSVLSFDANLLDTISDSELSKFIIVLGQYLVSLKFKENEITVEKIEVEKEFDRLSMSEIRSREWKTGVTLKEKTSIVIETNHKLKELDLLKDILDGQLTMLDGMYESFLEYLNTYKREQGRRSGDYSISRFQK